MHDVNVFSSVQTEYSPHVPVGEQTRVCLPHLPHGRVPVVSGMQLPASSTLVSSRSLVSLFADVSIPAASMGRFGRVLDGSGSEGQF